MICHIIFEHDYSYEFNNFINQHFDIAQHTFFVIGRASWDTAKQYSYINSHYTSDLDCLKCIEAFEEAQHIIIHGLFHRVVTTFFFNHPRFLKKTDWVVWGGDFYTYREAGTPVNPIEYEEMRKVIIRGMGRIITFVFDDFTQIQKVYETLASYEPSFYPLFLDFNFLDATRASQTQNQFPIIQIGNSGTSTNCHLEAFTALQAFKGDYFDVYCPLAYGDQAYIENIIAQGKVFFNDNFYPITKFLPYIEYAELLNTVNVAIMNHNRQQAAGNILLLLYLGKKVYMSANSTLFKFFKSVNLSIYDISEIHSSSFHDFISFSGYDAQHNIRIIKNTFSIEKCKEAWAKVFDNSCISITNTNNPNSNLSSTGLYTMNPINQLPASARTHGRLAWDEIRRNGRIMLYAGDIPAGKNYDDWIGLSLTQEDGRHLRHDVTNPLPLPNNSVDAFQAEDVFEHIQYDRLVSVLNEVHRVLKPGAFFRLSVPDYRCDILMTRSQKDNSGNIVFDPGGGGTPEDPGHVWFPRYETLKSLLEKSAFGDSGTINFLHYYGEDGTQVTNSIDYSKGYIQRTPDHDQRVQTPYRPMSLVVDLVKTPTPVEVQELSLAGRDPLSAAVDIKFSFVMIVLNGMPFIEYALKAIYEEAHEIIIIEGAVEQCRFAANADGSSTDGTVEFIHSFTDPARKIRFIQGQWPEKCEMQNAALSYVTGTHVWLVDSDEIYREDDIKQIRTLLAKDPGITQVNFIPDNFWKGFDFLFVDPCFFETPHHYRRLFKFVPGARFTSHRPPTMVWPGGSQTTEEMNLLGGASTRKMGIYPYHYSYVLESQVQQKIELYRRYGWDKGWGINLEQWYRDFYKQWTPENRHKLELNFPIWTGSRKSYSVPFIGSHPKVIEKSIKSFKSDNSRFSYDVYFDLNDGCNLECVMCGGKKKAHNQNVMSISDFHGHLLPLLRSSRHYQFGCRCEPLMVPYFVDAVDMLPEPAENGPQARIVTNATLFSSEKLTSIIEKGIFRRILISIDGSTADVYEQIRKGAKYDQFINNLKALVDRAKVANSSASIEFIFTIQRNNYHQLPDIVQQASQLGVKRVMTHKLSPTDICFIDDDFYTKVTETLSHAHKLARQLSVELVDPRFTSASCYGAERAAKSACDRHCSLSFNNRMDFIVDYTGAITTPCSRISKPIGNILDSSIEDIITGEIFKQFVSLIDDPVKSECASCYLFQELPEEKKVPVPAKTPIMQHVIEAIGGLKTKFNTDMLFAVETGTIRSYDEKHESTRHISAALGNRGYLISVDCNQESLRISRDICNNSSNVTWIESLSVPFLEKSRHLSFHFALLDSANDKDLIFEEFRLVAPLIVENGIVIIDDAGIGINRAIDTMVPAQKGHKVWSFLCECGAVYDVLETPAGHGTQIKITFTPDNRRLILAALTRFTTSNTGIRIAGEGINDKDLTQIQEGSEFEVAIRELITSIKPRTIIETGTYLGNGTTRIIASALRDIDVSGSIFYSIECNPTHHRLAHRNLSSNGLLSNVRLLLGLSVPRSALPTKEDIYEDTIKNLAGVGIFVDHKEHERVALYHHETDFPDLPDDLLGRCLTEFRGEPDLVILDSGGHMGNIEFNYVIENLHGDCYIVLDDIGHIKHHKSFQQIISDSRFTLLTSSDEKFGFCIARFTPTMKRFQKKKILWLRPDSIGDNILAMSMLPHLREHHPDAEITVLCQDHIAELYEACPFINSIIPFNRQWALNDESYRKSILQQLKDINADISFCTVFSREPLTDYFAADNGARERLAFNGDLCNISLEDRNKNNNYYTSVLPCEYEHRTELERHRDFLRDMGICVDRLDLTFWVGPDDVTFADRIFQENNLDPEKTIVLFAGAQNDIRLYDHYGTALSDICRKNGFSVIALGSSMDRAINQKNLDVIGTKTVNLCGDTTLRQSGAILSRCRLAVGAETGLAHIACAVDTPNVIVLGGGHFGRFMPYSPLTSVACLPLDCYYCNWRCRFDRPYCVQAITPEIISMAVSERLGASAETPRIHAQNGVFWGQAHSKPQFQESSLSLIKVPAQIHPHQTSDKHIFTISGLPTPSFDEMKAPIFYYKKWVKKLLVENTGIASTLLDKQFRNVVIFGTREIAVCLMNDCLKNGINVVSFLDNNFISNNRLEDIPIHKPEWLASCGKKIDAIILSIEGNHDETIRKQLEDIIKDNNIFILSWKELL